MSQPPPLTPEEIKRRDQEDRYMQEAKSVDERLTRAKAVAEARRERVKKPV